MKNPRLNFGVMLVLLILKEKHPEPVHRDVLNARFKELINEHGTIENAVEHMRRKMLL